VSRRLPDGAWVRADLHATAFAVDTVALDVDGVLVDVRESFREVVRATTVAMQRRMGVPQPWHPTQDDVSVFKRAGGFNDDVDLSIALTAIGAGGRGDDAQRIAHEAELAGGGLPALRIVAPDLPRVVGREVLEKFDELYWGRENTADDGLVNRERAMVGSDFPEALHSAGARAVALVTGRTPRELDAALARLSWRREQLCHVVTGDMVRKPDPACLDAVEHLCASLSVVYVGDVRDDWELVRRWRAERPDAIATRCILVGDDGEMERYRRLGVDATVRLTSDVPAILQGWATAR
jgi:HAD superfamily phosphatase